jgi:hypothetical protein
VDGCNVPAVLIAVPHAGSLAFERPTQRVARAAHWVRGRLSPTDDDLEERLDWKIKTRWILAAWATLSSISAVGTVMTPMLRAFPLLLIALTPRLPILALAATTTNPVLFFCVAVPRMTLPDPIHIVLGRRYGERFVPPRARRLMARLGLVGVALRPTSKVLAAAGACKLSTPRILIADVLGTVGLVVSVYVAAQGGAALIWAACGAPAIWAASGVTIDVTAAQIGLGLLVRASRSAASGTNEEQGDPAAATQRDPVAPLDVHPVASVELVGGPGDLDSARSRHDEDEHVVSVGDEVVVLAPGREHDPVDAHLALGVGQPLHPRSVGGHDRLADAPPAEARQQLGDRQVEGATQPQQHRQRCVRVAVLDLAEVARRDARTRGRVAQREAPRHALLA